MKLQRIPDLSLENDLAKFPVKIASSGSFFSVVIQPPSTINQASEHDDQANMQCKKGTKNYKKSGNTTIKMNVISQIHF